MSGHREDNALSAQIEREKQEGATAPGYPEPLPVVRATPVTILCPECGEMVEVHDIHAVLLALHLQNECTLSSLFHAHRDDG